MGYDWYANRDKLQPDMVFQQADGEMIMLVCRVPGDGSAWYYATWDERGFWQHNDDTIEPGDLGKLGGSDFLDE